MVLLQKPGDIPSGPEGSLQEKWRENIYKNIKWQDKRKCLKSKILDIRKKIVFYEGEDTQEQLSREAVDAQFLEGQFGCSSEKPSQEEDGPTCGRGVGKRQSLRSLPTLAVLLFFPGLQWIWYF